MSDPIVRLPLRIRASLKEKLAELAEKEHRSLNKQIEFLLDWCINELSKAKNEGSQSATQTSLKRK